MKRLVMVTILAWGLFTLGTSSASAQNGIPPGSYQLSCSEVSVNGNVLNATCNPSGSSKKFKIKNSLEDFFLCADDIRNSDGSLVCTKSIDSPRMKKIKVAIEAVFPKIHGRQFKGDSVVFVRDLFKTRKDAVDIFYKGEGGVAVSQYLRELIRKPDESQARLAVIDRAFKDVYGFGPYPESVAFWNAEIQKGGNFYENIVAGETKKLNTPGSDGKNPSRRLMINSAYKKTMGRNATAKEISFWENKPENFRQLVETTRNWLYSTVGRTDLTETITRKLTEKKGGTPSREEINQAIVDYGKTRLIYSEM